MEMEELAPFILCDAVFDCLGAGLVVCIFGVVVGWSGEEEAVD